jgi:hypothetical protein
MNLETTRPRGRPRNRWQDKVRENGRMVGVGVWQEKVYNREEWKKLLRTTRNHHILHTPMESMDCRLTTKKAIYKKVIQVISTHRQSKKRQYHAYFATTLHKMQRCTAIYIKCLRKWKPQPSNACLSSSHTAILCA